MSSIDDRVVRMEFDNKQFEQGVSTTMTTLEKLNEVLRFRKGTAGFEDIQRASEAVNFSPLTESLLQVQNHFSFFGQFAMNLFNRISNKIIDLGSTMVRELTTAPLRAGFSEYELQMTSTQTIMASTGKSIDEITRYLDELNTYADKTIYSFSDMTSNIGKFTNAGVDLDVAVRAIQGISNEAAVSGANAAEASRAMYNFAQALSAGYVKLIDWKSIENANMATKEFKEQLLETAVAVGTVEKTADGMYRVLSTSAQGGTMNDVISATKNFNDSLSYQWMTTDVLTQTLAKYADETTEIGRKAFAAATEVKTFSQLIDTVKESLGSGWTKSFTYIIGNLEEAKVLWTGVNNEINAILDPIAEAREEMLKFWHDNGGRDTAIQAIADAWQGVKEVMKTVSNTFESVFPPMTGERLIEITKSIGDLAARFKKFATSTGFLTRVSTIFKGFFVTAKELIGVAKSVAKALSPLVSIFFDFGGVLFDAVYRLGLFAVWLSNTDNPIELTKKKLSYLGDIVRSVITGFEDLIKSILDFIGIHIEGNPLTEFFDSVSSIVSSLFGSSGFNVFSTVAEVIEGVVERIKTAFGSLTSGDGVSFDVGGAISGMFEGIVNALSEWIPKITEYLGSQEFRDLLATGGLAAGGGALLTSIFSLSQGIGTLGDTLGDLGEDKSFVERLGDLLKGMFKPFTDFADDAVKKVNGFLDDLHQHLVAFQEGIKIGMLLAIAATIGVLAASITALSEIDSKSAADAIATLFVSMLVVIGAMKLLEKALNGGLISSKIPMLMMGVALGLGAIGAAVKYLSDTPWNELKNGLLAVGALLFEFAIFTQLVSDVKVKLGSIFALLAVAAAVSILEDAVVVFSKIRWDQIIPGLMGVCFLIYGVVGAVIALDKAKPTVRGIITILAIAAAVKVLEDAVVVFSSIRWDQLIPGLIAVCFLVLGVAGAVAAMDKAKPSLRGIATILTVAYAVSILEDSVVVFSDMRWEKIVTGLFGVGAILGSIVSAIVVLNGVKVPITAIATIAMITFAIMKLSEVVIALGSLTTAQYSTGLGVFTGVLWELVIAIAVLGQCSPMMIVGAASLLIVAGAIMVLTPSLEALSKLDFLSIIASLGAVALGMIGLSFAVSLLGVAAPLLALFAGGLYLFSLAVGNLVTEILRLSEGFLSLASSIVAVEALKSLIDTLAEGVGKVMGAVAGGIVTFIVTLVKGIGEIAAAIATTLRDNAPIIVEAIGGVIMILLTAITTFIPNLVEVVGLFVVTLVQAIVGWLPAIAGVLVVGVVTLINSLANGIRDNSEAILAAVRNILSSIIELVLTALADIVSLIPGVGETLAGFIEDGKEGVRQALAPESFEGMTDEAMSSAVAGVESGSADLSAATAEAGEQANESFFESFIGDSNVSVDGFMSPILTDLEGYTGDFGDIADLDIEAYADSFLTNGPTTVNPAVGQLSDDAISVLDGYVPQYTSTGENSTLGFGNGLISDYALSYVRRCALNVTSTVVNTMQNSLQVKSPSRVTMRIGKYTGQGLAIGIQSMVGEVYKESSAAGNRAIDGIRDSLGEMSKYLDDDLDVDPTIRPVMDLSEIQNGVGLMNRMVDNGIPDPLIGIGMNAYPQMMMSAMRGYSTASQIPSQVNAGETTTYNLYIDGVRVNADEDIRNLFIDLMYQLKAKERGYVG